MEEEKISLVRIVRVPNIKLSNIFKGQFSFSFYFWWLPKVKDAIFITQVLISNRLKGFRRTKSHINNKKLEEINDLKRRHWNKTEYISFYLKFFLLLVCISRKAIHIFKMAHLKEEKSLIYEKNNREKEI